MNCFILSLQINSFLNIQFTLSRQEPSLLLKSNTPSVVVVRVFLIRVISELLFCDLVTVTLSAGVAEFSVGTGSFCAPGCENGTSEWEKWFDDGPEFVGDKLFRHDHASLHDRSPAINKPYC